MTVTGNIETGGVVAGWQRTHWLIRTGLVVLVLVIAVELFSSLYGGIVGTRIVPGVPTSPYATNGSGTAGFVALLERAGVTVVLRDGAVSPSDVPAGSALLAINPVRWTTLDQRTAAFVAATGGRVVFFGAAPPDPGPPLPAGTKVTFTPTASGDVVGTVPDRLTVGVHSLVTGAFSLHASGAARAVVTAQGGPFVVTSGAVVWVASSVPIRNANLDKLDDAALAWNLARPWRHEVVIDVASMTPATRESGLLALPSYWQAGLAILGLAALLWLASASRRFGPFEPRARSLAPARIGYVDAMASLLGTYGPSHTAETTAAVSREARRALRRRLRRAPDDELVGIDKDAAELGIPDWVVSAATTAPANRADAVEVGEALAWLLQQEGAT